MKKVARGQPSTAGSASIVHHTSSVLVLRWLLSSARRSGSSTAKLLDHLGIAHAVLDDVDARIAEPVMRRAWSALASSSGDEAFGLHHAQQTPEGEFDVLEYAVSFSDTLRAALDRVARFYRLISDTLAVEILEKDRTTQLVRVVRGTDPQDQDAFFAMVLQRFRDGSRGPICPKEVCFEHAAQAQRELAEFFQCPVRFGRRQCVMVFASSDLEQPMRAAKPRLAALLDRYAAELLARLPATSSYTDHVRQAITHSIQRGAPTLEATARTMHTSPRTVQRRLSGTGTTHKRLVDEVRRELAFQYIESPRLSITEIAFLLGYSDESSFRRSFKKWAGKSPSEARHRAASPAPA